MTGSELRTALRATNKKMAQISKDVGIPEATIYWWYKRPKIAEHIIDAFEKAGYKVQAAGNLDDLKDQLIKTLTLALQSERDQKEVYQRIIIKGLESDHLFFDAIAAKLDKTIIKQLLKKK